MDITLIVIEEQIVGLERRIDGLEEYHKPH